MVRFCYFHLMPYAELDESSEDWPIPNGVFDPTKGAELYRTYLDQMAFAEDCGFDWIGCNEHHYSPYGLMANPNLIGAILAQRTQQVKLAMLGNIVPIGNPVRVAEEYAMLDVLSGGRLIAGFMRGIAHEYAAYNVPPDDSWSRQQEAFELIVRAWTEPEPFRWEGEHYQFRSVSIWPKPLQRPHPPILLSGGSVESAEFAAKHHAMMGIVQLENLEVAKRNADVYRDAARAAGWDPDPECVMVGLHTCVADTDEEARELLGKAEQYFYSVLSGGPRTAQRIILQKTRYHGERTAQYQAERRERLKAMNLDDRIESGTVLCGSPATVVKQIKRVVDTVGNGVFNVNFKIGQMSNAQVRHGMELFRDKVLPEVPGR